MKKNISVFLSVLMVFGLLFVLCKVSIATEAETNKYPNVKLYEIDPDEKYAAKDKYLVKKGSFGKESIGELMISGSIMDETTYNGIDAYPVKGDISIKYIYNKSDYEIKDEWDPWADNEDKWYINSDSAKSIDGWGTGGKIKSGGVIVLASDDGIHYEILDKAHNDYFSKYQGSNNLCSFTVEEMKQGKYIKILVAYKMEVRTKDNFVNDDYEEHRYLEKYEFFLSYEKTPVAIRDIDSRTELSNDSKVTKGFYLDYSGYNGKVTVTKPSGTEVSCVDGMSFSEPGKYVISTKTSMGTIHETAIQITEGLKYTEVLPTVYQLSESKNYVESKESILSSNTVFGSKSHTKIKIGSQCNKGSLGEFDAYGVLDSDVFFYLSYNQSEDNSYNGWQFVSDDYGKTVGETVTKDKISVGEIGSGAIIIRTSSDGKNWEGIGSNYFSNGFKNTDVSNSYGTAGDISIYSPNGKDVINGVYYQVIYCYEVQNGSAKYDYIEKYTFYLCYDDISAIQIHNLTLTEDTITTYLGQGYSTDSVKTILNTETMLNNSYSITGFEVNPYIELDNGDKIKINASITYKLNGKTIVAPSDLKFTKDGCYEVNITSAIGTEKKVCIYVDTMTNEEALDYYFGGSFIQEDSKRILGDDSYATFEGGLTYYNINVVDDYHKPLTGTMTNMETLEVVKELNTSDAGLVCLKEPGRYCVEFSTYDPLDSAKAGDIRKFTFYFRIIEEGSAPGPVKNAERLIAFSSNTVSESKCVYYGFTICTAGVGSVTLIFDSREEAEAFCVPLEKNNVNEKENKWVYTPSYEADSVSFDKENDAMNYAALCAEMHIEKKYFDMSRPETFYTIRDEDLVNYESLKDMHIAYEVYLFGDNQKELMSMKGETPIINDKPTCFVDPDGGKQKDNSDYQFVFKKDDYELDSSSITITDSTGRKTIDIEYDTSVQHQLEEAGFASGMITIEEETKYGDKATYNAYYIKPGINNTTYTIVYKLNDIEYRLDISQEKIPEFEIEAEMFSVESINDSVDPYGLLLVKKSSGEEEFCMPCEELNNSWVAPGEYTITCVNRYGYNYSYTLRIISSDNVVISFVDEDMVVIDSETRKVGEKDISLPQYEKEGYTLAGFIDLNSQTVYKDKIECIEKNSQMYLQAIWEPITITLTYYDEYDRELQSVQVEYDSTYSLRDYTSPNGKTFVGWTNDGVNVYSDMITITDTSNLYLTPVLQDEIIETTETEQSTVETNQIEETTTTISDAQADKIATNGVELNTSHESNNRKTAIVLFVIGFISLSFGGLFIIFMNVRESKNNRR